MSDYLISEETLTETADAIRAYLSEVGDGTHVISEEYTGDTWTLQNVEVFFFEDIDSNGDILQTVRYGNAEEYDSGMTDYSYAENNEGQRVPVIYSDGMRNNGFYDCYYYVGIDEIGDVLYDKWRKIENLPDQTEESYTWDSLHKNYIYTNRIVVAADSTVGIDPVDFPERVRMVYAAGEEAGKRNAIDPNAFAELADRVEGIAQDTSDLRIDTDLNTDDISDINLKLQNIDEVIDDSMQGNVALVYDNSNQALKFQFY